MLLTKHEGETFLNQTVYISGQAFMHGTQVDLSTVQGTGRDGYLQLIDLAPTVCALVGCRLARADGRSFVDLLLGMRYDDPAVRPLLDLEGLKAWRPGRTSGYGQLEQAVKEVEFYDGAGNVTAAGYRP